MKAFYSTMGGIHSSVIGDHWVASIKEPETTPQKFEERSHDPNYGFDGKRKERGQLTYKFVSINL